MNLPDFALPDYVEAWIDGVATPEEAERLQAWLREDREHARALMRAMRLHQALREQHQGEAGAAAPRGATKKPSLRLVARRRRARKAGMAIWAAAACLLIGAGWWLMRSGSTVGYQERRPVVAHLRIDASATAEIWSPDGTATQPGEWRTGRASRPAHDGDAVATDDIVRAASGAATVAFDDGTTVALSSGTASTIIERGGKMAGLIGDGTLTVAAAKQKPGSPMRCQVGDEALATIVGTRFALAARSGKARLEVSEGRVRFERLRDHATVEVAAGEAADTADATLAAKPLSAPTPRWAAYWSRWPNRPFAKPDFFPIAVWNQDPLHAESYRNVGVNLYVGLWQGPTEEQLAKLKSAGMPVICAQNEVGLQHRDDAIIAGWFLDEGADNARDGKRGRAPDEVVAQYRRWSEADPTRPIQCNFGPGVAIVDWIGRGQDTGHVELYPRYLRGCDIASFDLYPFADPAEARVKDQPWRMAEGIDHLREWSLAADPRGRPAWCWIESGRIRDGGPAPTREQVRAEAWMAIVHGAAGIGWFCHRFGPGDQVDPTALLHDAAACATVAAIDAEIAAHARALNLPAAEGVSATVADAAAPVDVRAWPEGGGLFIAAVAMRDHAGRATIRLPWPARVERVDGMEQVGESRRLDAASGSFQGSFAPYGVQLYQATPLGH